MISAPVTDLRSHVAQLLARAVAEALPEQHGAAIALERPKQAGHGDYSCNLALQLAKPLKRNPRDIAQALVRALPPAPLLAKAEVAGAGFINLFLTPAAKQRVVTAILTQGDKYGRIGFGQGKKVQVEFVSANPTGPLHVGHGRGAAFGASLANVLDAAGFVVTREFYVNDAGRQMDILALSTWLRYLELNGLDVPFPPNAYQGKYVREMAQAIVQAHGRRYAHAPHALLAGVTPPDVDVEAHLDGLIANAKQVLGEDYAYVHDFVLTEQLGDCRNDLLEFGVSFDHWFSEKSLYDSGQVERALEKLQQAGIPLYAGRGEVVSQFGVRGREGPRGATGERAVHLLWRRYRLSSEQVRARLRSGNRRVGRRSSRLHRARKGRAAGAWDQSGPAHRRAGAIRGALSRRQESFHVHPRGRLRHLARVA
jgi:arginyl-tRNA synthetase